MKTTFRFMLVFYLTVGLFAFPSTTLADDDPPDNPLLEESLMMDGAPAVQEDNLQPEGIVPQAANSTTHYKTLTGLDFHPIDSDMTFSSTNGGLYPLALVAGYGYSAAYNLPDGASVTGITFFIIDNDAGTNISLSANRFSPATNEPFPLSSISTSGASTSIQSINLTGGLPFTIYNNTYAYRLRVEFGSTGSSQMVYGARISYTLPSTPPSVYHYVSMAGADFRSSSSNMTYAAMGGTLYATAIDSSYYFYTRLDLPEGAVIDEIRWYVIDNVAEYCNLRLYGHTVAIDIFGIEVSASTLGDDPSSAVRTLIEDVSITVENRNKAYFIGFLPREASSDLRIVGARVRYTLSPTIDPRTNPIKTISGINISPTGSSLTYRALGAKLYALVLSSGRSFQVGLNLPANIHINKITFYFKDNSDQNISFTGRYYFPLTGNYLDPVNGSSSDTSDGIRTVTFSDIGSAMGVFDTYDMVARLRVVLGIEGQNMYLVGAKVEYIYPQVYLPLIEKE